VAFQRALQHGTERLDYNVYLHPSLQGVFGDGTGGTQTIPACFGSACATDASQSPSVATLYGAIPPNQDIDPGVYQDTLLIQVAF
jgi:spore coat protein U-like protein